MKNLSDINGITPEQVELLEAAGFLEPNSLRATTIDELHDELLKANSMLQIVTEPPSRQLVAKWFEQVDADVDVFSPLETQGQAVKPQFAAAARTEDFLQQKVPVAIRVTKEFVKQKQIDLESLPRVGAVVERQFGAEPSKRIDASEKHEAKEYEVAAEKDAAKIEPRLSIGSLPSKRGGNKAGAPRERISKEIQKEKVLSMDEFRVKGGKVAPLQRSNEKDLTKTTLESTNRGIDPKSRRYIRGVLHKEPGAVKIASFSILLTQVLIILSVLPLPLIFVDRDKYFWAVFSPALLFVALFLWLLFARKASCPVCRQRQFVPKACLKHNKAHRLPLIGYMASTAIHILSFKWFRCIFCGTSIRLKE